MIEITAKQLYDIYAGLPDTSEYSGKTYRVSIMTHADIKSINSCGDHNRIFSAQKIEFLVDRGTEWKPTTDLIIKA